MRRIEDDINVLEIIQMTKPLGLRLRFRSRLQVEVRNGLKAYCTLLKN